VACGYDFVIGVSTQAHKEALLEADFSLDVLEGNVQDSSAQAGSPSLKPTRKCHWTSL
jgi:hypothetical protein